MKMQHIINSRPGTGSQIRQLRASAAPARGRKWLAAAAVRGVAPGGAGGRGDADGGPLPDAARGLEPEALPLLASQVWREAQLQLGEEQAAGGWGGSQGEGPGQASQAPGAVALAGDAAASGRQQPRMGRGPPVGSDVTMDDAGGGGKVDKESLTQFGRAMAQLGIGMIPAYSPEARSPAKARTALASSVSCRSGHFYLLLTAPVGPSRHPEPGAPATPANPPPSPSRTGRTPLECQADRRCSANGRMSGTKFFVIKSIGYLKS